MASQTRSTLKGYFNTGDKPTETQFADLIDSGLNLTDGGTVAGITVFSSHITASGNISASGTVIANSFPVTICEVVVNAMSSAASNVILSEASISTVTALISMLASEVKSNSSPDVD